MIQESAGHGGGASQEAENGGGGRAGVGGPAQRAGGNVHPQD